MKSALVLLVLCAAATVSNGQGFFSGLRNLFRPRGNPFNFFGGGGRFRDDGTQRPQQNGVDELLPSDCGRNTRTGRGKLCFPVGNLCANSKSFTYLVHCFALLIDSWKLNDIIVRLVFANFFSVKSRHFYSFWHFTNFLEQLRNDKFYCYKINFKNRIN